MLICVIFAGSVISVQFLLIFHINIIVRGHISFLTSIKMQVVLTHMENATIGSYKIINYKKYTYGKYIQYN